MQQIKIADGMSDIIIVIGPDLTLQDAARKMKDQRVGAVVVIDPDGYGPSILTERDVLHCVADCQDTAVELVRDHQTNRITTMTPGQPMDAAAEAMLAGGFRHVVVVDDAGEPIGMLSMRDVIRVLMRELKAPV